MYKKNIIYLPHNLNKLKFNYDRKRNLLQRRGKEQTY
jgi:hypothetical protein